MKTNTLIILAVVVLFNSCTQTPKHQVSTVSTEPDTTGYYSARDLKGLGYFILGQSTFKDTQAKIKAEMRKEPKYNVIGDIDPFYTELVIKQGDSTVFYQNPSERSVLDDNAIACPYNKTIKMYKYFLAGLELSNVKLDFYKDTLIRISVDNDDKLIEAFNFKYGKGLLKDETIWNTPFGEKRERPSDALIKSEKATVKSIYQYHRWKNVKVNAVSLESIRYSYKADKSIDMDYTSVTRSFEINFNDDNLIKKAESLEIAYKDLYEKRRKALADKELNNL